MDMNPVMMIITVLLPFLTGIAIPLLPFRKKEHAHFFMEALVILNSVLVFALLLNRPEENIAIVRFTGDLTLSLRIDGMSMVFGGLVAALWPLASLYAIEYMKHEKNNEKIFFMFYTITYGVVLGIAFAEDLVTMYFFYELLTLMTLPLIMFTLSREAILASRKYLYYSLGGAAFGFIGMIFIIIYGSSPDFVLGGTLDLMKVGDKTNVLLLIYVLAFLGFGVKAAVCPFNSWLPDAGVAPTPVTALLHAVAVVKSGAFAIIRLTYYCFGTEFLRGTWAQDAVMAVVIVTIVYGCSRAVKETHMKRRLAYSTISNLSYILFGVTIMTPLGLVGALSHMVFHAVMKICSFFCVGAVMYKTGRNYVYEIDGFGRKMPCVFGIFTLSAFALMGVPGLCGFISKWNLANAAAESDNLLAFIGVGALLISALLTAIYMLTMVIRAFFPEKGFDYKTISDVEDPNWYMLLPLFLFAAAMIVFGLHSAPVAEFFDQISKGMY